MSYLDFKGWLVAQNIKQIEVAKVLGISLQALSKKLNGKAEFSVKQVKTICEHYHISAEIFLR